MSSSERRRGDGSPVSATTWYHFAGIGGSGMSALAQFHAMAGGRVTGSDRAFDEGQRQQTARHLADLGVTIIPQDGSGPQPGCDAVIVSTAVEDRIPDVQAARRLGIPIRHRSELLAQYVGDHRTIAVTGTSGKSTVVAMIFTILQAAGREPSLLTGGPLVELQRRGTLGNAWAGRSEWLVIEADESDGSVVRYEPWCGVLLNLRLDHKDPRELAEMFDIFRERTRGPFLIGEDENLDRWRRHDRLETAVRFGLGQDCEVKAEELAIEPHGCGFMVGETDFRLPLTGRYNVINALAAIAACRAVGIPLAEMRSPLSEFGGVARRFQSIGIVRDVEVIDDFAHNPDKIGAALDAARARGKRLLAVFQPHGFGPTRFLRDALIETFASHLTPEDRLWLPEIFYAGGSVTKDISAADIVDAVRNRGVTAFFAEHRETIVEQIAAEATAGDVILVMGARDPSLTEFCRRIVQRLQDGG